ncbi:uncharacterized protein F5Z01DRAFT_644985 [Emericellopsis atlantica]|uniref:Uncharacterized protein n=1 Tax=Emericellopsis atlantica TaxID=2614577 RepID=A0A9P7ZTK1_9HYPO|nr:uncharacterized protein F5Z01DRAFT_644985 [Emericellopsis atlantica]KAG9258054.1 hypothetical protein F5Z01DRAFT_644985 [Emericellopsis atlantica]
MPSPRVRILLRVLGLLAFPFALWRIIPENYDDAARRVADAGRVAVGFDLGQSYATSVAHFSNGTVVSLPKIPGSEDYIAFMARMNNQPPSFLPDGYVNQRPSRPQLLQDLWTLFMRSIGLPPSKDAAVLVRMKVALKAASEVALGHAIDSAAVTAPWRASWQHEVPSLGIVNTALLLAGITPVALEDNDTLYMGEINSLLAAHKRKLCPAIWCADHFGSDAGEPQPINFLISFTNQSLHTSFQVTRCFFLDSWSNDFGTIDSRYGLDKLMHMGPERREDFWTSIHDHLVERVTKYLGRHSPHPRVPFLALVAGEASDTPEFRTVLQEVTESVARLRVADARSQGEPEGTDIRPMELLIADDPTFAAARGAAFWMRMQLDWSYCEDCFASRPGEYVSQYDMLSESHVEL